MSIIIKTMTNLPDHCYDCPCHDGESGYCQADKDHRYSDYRPFWCPLEETREESKIGHWVEEIIKCGRKVFCSECGCSPPFEYVSDGDVYSPSGYGVINKTKFCPNCGARMIDSKERKEQNG